MIGTGTGEKGEMLSRNEGYETGTGGKGVELSRNEAIRDRSRWKRRGAVPKRGDTGQEQVKKAWSCLETRRYRTGTGEKGAELSRNGVYSVRSRVNGP
ncbi:hypothetical protein [Bacillus sp. Marseille-Q3570]|uniref:hypothetical protein n=1 Tax=Bacillus sp. Marseille-Q3570 TaxID=2963522 RepID=UPI0021B70730|nr:hypothetical protein [Bacillus sp. Marseille-Q3570]